MAGRGPTRQELIRRGRRSGFVGRQGELSSFRGALQRSPEDVTQFLFHIRGQAGVGKSTLIRQLDSAAREAQSVTAYVDESVTDAIEAMRAVSAQLGQQGAALKGFDRLLATYRQRRHEADADGASAARGPDRASGEKAGSASPAGVVASRIGLAGLGMIPGVGAFTSALDPNQVAAAAEHAKVALSARLRSHEDVELVLSPLAVLTPAFLQDLAEVAQRRPWIALFFDTYERIGPLLDVWLRDVLVGDRYGEVPANLLVVLAGQGRLDPQCWGDWLDLVADLPLEVFTESEARQLLAAKDVTDERIIEVILELSGRLPVLVSTLAEARPAAVAEVGDPSGTAVERFLKWETDPARREAALACALPQELDEDVYRAAVADEEARELFGWLRSMPFVTDRGGHCRYHDLVRAAMLRLQRRQSPARWREQHTRLADTFQQWQERPETGSAGRPDTGSAGPWQSARLRGHRLHETYHRLCADPDAALPAALLELLDVIDRRPAELRRWAQSLAQAGQDADAAEVTRWGKRLADALDETRPLVAVLTLLLTWSGLDTPSRVLAYTLRGREHGNGQQYELGLADYDAALALEPESAAAFHGRGRIHYNAERYEEGLADFERAVGIDPGHLRAFTYIGDIHRKQRRYDEALGCYDRALRIEPGDAWALASRGETHRMLKMDGEALADLNQAVAINPRYAWALGGRGDLHRRNGRYGEALADFDRAIEIDPRYAWAIARRGRVHQALDRYAEALADLDRAVELEPDSATAYAWRGQLREEQGRPAEALADLDRAIELDPAYLWAVNTRTSLHRVQGRYAESLADCERVLRLDPDDTFAIANRAVNHRLLGRYEEAIAAFDRLLENAPDLAWYHYEKAVALHAVGHPDRDRHLARVVETITSDPAARMVVDWGNLVLAHCAMPAWEEAERCLEAFLDKHPTPGRVGELIAALASLVRVIPSAGSDVAPLVRRLEGALGEAEAVSRLRSNG